MFGLGPVWEGEKEQGSGISIGLREDLGLDPEGHRTTPRSREGRA